jgi:hypothetical protein
MGFPDKVFLKDSTVVSKKIGEEFILVPIQKKTGDLDSIYTMNEVSARIWELIDGKKCINDIRNKIVEEYEIDNQSAEVDITDFVKKLQHIGAIKEV